MSVQGRGLKDSDRYKLSQLKLQEAYIPGQVWILLSSLCFASSISERSEHRLVDSLLVSISGHAFCHPCSATIIATVRLNLWP